MNYHSTMGAPLTENESRRIDIAWEALRGLSRSEPNNADPAQMLEHGTALIMAVYELRRAIDDGWFYANKRRFPPPETKVAVRYPTPSSRTANAVRELRGTGASDDEIVAALLKVKSRQAGG